MQYSFTVCNAVLISGIEAIALVPFEKKLVKVDMLDNDEVGAQFYIQ